MNPLISVITPAYNADRFLAEHLASVQGQTFTNFEHVIVDDGSTDSTRSILAAQAAADPRLHVIHQPNMGAHAARNAALAAARGRYVAFLDADDLWLPTKLEKQLAFMQEGGYAFSYHWYRTIDVAGNLLSDGPIWMPPMVDHAGYLRYNGTIGNLTVMLDRQQLGDFEMPRMGAEDFALFLQLLRRYPAHGLFEDLALHRVVPGSLSANKVTTMRWIWDVYRQQEGIGVFRTAWYMSAYIGRGIAKNVKHKRLQHRG